MKTSCIDGILKLFEVQEGASFKIAGQFYSWLQIYFYGYMSLFVRYCV